MNEAVTKRETKPEAAPEMCGELGAVTGTGRSGSTWLGAILNAHPEVAYRFEPFSRLRWHPSIREVVDIINAEDFSDESVGQVYERLLRSHPLTDKPPFFPKSHSHYRGKVFTWPLSRRISALQNAYGRWYSPRQENPLLIFKEVTETILMERLRERTNIRMIYLVRHPCSFVASMREGQRLNVMPSKRLNFLEGILVSHHPELAEEVVPQLDRISLAGKLALLWRCDVERGIRGARQAQHSHIMIYENLCREPMRRAEETLAFFGLDMDPRVTRFVEESSGEVRSSRWKHGELGISNYFSVFRSPLEMIEKWKTQLSDEEIRDVRRFVEDSEAYQYCADLGAWD